MKTNTGDGRTTCLFYDKWLDMGPLYRFIGPNVHTWGSKLTVLDWIRGTRWMIPPSFMRRYPNIAAAILNVQLTPQADNFVWTLNVNGKYSISSFYEQIGGKKARVDWHRLVWAGRIPQKYRFICWLLVRFRLKTKGLLQRKGMNISTDCVLCDDGFDPCSHLFFQCPYSKQIWKKVLAEIGVIREPLSWNHELQWLRIACKGRSRKSNLIRLALMCTVYSLWMERNSRIFCKN